VGGRWSSYIYKYTYVYMYIDEYICIFMCIYIYTGQEEEEDAVCAGALELLTTTGSQVCCRVLQYVAVCCSMLQYAAVYCSVL